MQDIFGTGPYISKIYEYFKSINDLNKYIKVSRATIKMYLNTNVPYKNYLFYSNPIKNFEECYKIIKQSTKELTLNHNIAKKVWTYFILSAGDINKIVFDSREKVAKFLNVNTKSIRDHIDKSIIGGINGYYLFSKELNEIETQNFIKLSLQKRKYEYTVWAYKAESLELVTEPFNSLQKAAEYFNVDYRTILSNLDTKVATKRKGELVIFFSNKLNEDIKKHLLENIKIRPLRIFELWVYKNLDGKLILINNNQPTFVSKNQASKELGISNKTISKYLDTHKYYNNLLFYSKKLN